MGNSYLLYQKYIKIGDQTPHPAYPAEYSIDGDGTMPLVLKTASDPNCDGADGTMYQWVVVAGEYLCSGSTKYQKEKEQVSTDFGTTWTDTGNYRTGSVIEYNSDDCGYVEPQYRTVSGEPYCNGYTKMYDTYNQVSYDGGQTWQNTGVSGSTVIEYDSEDCGYVPPVDAQYRWVGTGEYICLDDTVEYVDLELPSGTLWAIKPLLKEGTNEPLYFAWGETVGYTLADVRNGIRSFDRDSYQVQGYDDTDGKVTLELQDDAAHVILGGQWHIPTMAEYNELIANTTLVVYNRNSVWLRSKRNTSRELPLYFNGSIEGTYPYPPENSAGLHEYSWSNQRVTGPYAQDPMVDIYPAGYFWGNSTLYTGAHVETAYYRHRYYGFTIRACRPANNT